MLSASVSVGILPQQQSLRNPDEGMVASLPASCAGERLARYAILCYSDAGLQGLYWKGAAMHKRHGGRGLCALLAFSVALSGCTSVRTQYHPCEGENAALKVAPYWRGMSGQRHFISDIAIEVIPLGQQEAEPLYGTTVQDCSRLCKPATVG